ncbi:Nuclear pore complex [Aspergillus sp. HF37]|nr:Nuclear pore complex [Aspergillus sp. HF37]
MEGPDTLAGFQGLFQDLSALSSSSVFNIERLREQLDAHIDAFHKLLDRPRKSNTSRQTVLSGKIPIGDVEYSLNDDFKGNVLQLADAVDLDEVEAATLFFSSQDHAQLLDRKPLVAAIMLFHERRQFLLECLRLILSESFEVEREVTQELMQEMMACVLEIKDGPLRNASLFARKCMESMADIEKWLLMLAEQAQKATVVGNEDDVDTMEAIDFQRLSLLQQHESLGAILCYLFKGPYTSSEELRLLLNRLRKLDRFDGLLVHYIPSVISSFAQHGSPEGSASLEDARSLHSAVTSMKDGQPWILPTFHAAVIALWLATYSGWYFDLGPDSPVQGVDLEKESEERIKMFMTALDDGGLDFMLAICSGVNNEEWGDPARSELVALLLKESAASMPETEFCSGYLKTLLMENFEMFAESCVANMPDAVRMLKSDEDSQRLDQITALKDGFTSSLHRGVVEARTHLESFLMVIAFAFAGRQEAAQEFWADPDGNLYGFLQWASKRQTVPRVSAFCEVLCSISEGEENAAATHKFLSEEDRVMSAKFKRSTSMNWSQMFAELQLYASRVIEKPPTSQGVLRTIKAEPVEMSEPESPVMLTCYLRLMGHLCRQSGTIRDWMLHHTSFSVVNTLLALCSGPIPTHLRATAFGTLAALMTERTSVNGNEMWLSIDQWISGGSISASGLGKVPIVSNPLVWHEQQAFQKISESFDQTNAFVDLINSLVCPTFDSAGDHLWLPFPETLGASYRMPGIEPYIDFVLGQALSRGVPDLNEHQALLLTFNCLKFVVECLRSFNEHLVAVLNQSPVSSDPTLKASSSAAYKRLHPFSRVVEWLFNEDVIRTIFATAHQDGTKVARASSDSLLVVTLLQSIEVMSLVMDLQSTYFNLVRPFVMSQAGVSRTNVANSSLSSFEDSVLNNLSIVPALCRYCGTGHEQLTVTSMALLEKLSSSKKLNKVSSPGLAKWRSSNKIVEVLSTEVDVDKVSGPLATHMQADSRELEHRPTVAHLLLGFTHLGTVLHVSEDSLYSKGMSLLHAIIDFLQIYPDELGGDFLLWTIHLKRLAFEVLQHLWSSRLSSSYVLGQMRASRFLLSMFASQSIIRPNTPWDGFTIVDDEFWLSDSVSALAEFLLYRSHLYSYAATEVRAAVSSGSATLQTEILSTLFGNSTIDAGEIVINPTVFDLFDFADLDVGRAFKPPELALLNGIDLDACSKPHETVVLYDPDELNELVQVRRAELLLNGQLRVQDEEQFQAEATSLAGFVHATNQSQQVRFNHLLALRSWAELVSTMATCSDMDSGRRTSFILHTIQLILPKLEAAIQESQEEALELARVAQTLASKLDSTATNAHVSRSGDVIDEKLHQLFQICIRGIGMASTDVDLRETFYNVASLFVSRIIAPDPAHEGLRRQTRQVVKSASPLLVETTCEDAYGGQETCRISSILLLNLLAVLDNQAMPFWPSRYRNRTT